MTAEERALYHQLSIEAHSSKERHAGQMDRRDFLKQISVLPVVPLLDRVRTGDLNQDQGRPNVIILVFDSLSARHLSLYGYQRETTPNPARFARRAVVYHSHYAGGNFTTPGTASLLTGTYPWTHRAFNAPGKMIKPFEQKNVFALLSDRYTRIAYPHNIYANYLLNQLRENVDAYLDPQTFALLDDMFYRRFFSGDRDISLRALEDLLFWDNGLPGALFLALANEMRTLTSIASSQRKFERLYPRGIPYLSHYQVYFLLEDVLRGAFSFLRRARQPFVAYLHFFPPPLPLPTPR